MHPVVVNFLSQVNFCFSFVFVFSATGDKKIVEILLINLNSSFNLEVLISFDFPIRQCPLKTKQFRIENPSGSLKRKILFTLNS